MTTPHCIHVARAWLLAAAACLGCTFPASAASDLCRPSTTLPADQRLEIAVDAPGPTVWLAGRLVQALELPLAEPAGVLKRTLPVSGQAIGRGKLDNDQARLRTDDVTGDVTLRWGDRRSSVAVVGQVARNADGSELAASPALEDKADFEIAPGATVRTLGKDRVVIEPGATLIWRAQAGKPLSVYLAEPQRLLDKVVPASAQVVRTTPALVPQGGKLDVTIEAPGIGLRDEPPVFCLRVGDKSVVIPGRFNRQDGTAMHFDLRLDHDDIHKLLEQSDIWSRMRGVRADLQAIVYKGAQPVMDAQATLRLSSVRWSVAIGLAAMLVVGVAFALVMRNIRPFRMVKHMITQDSGRLSLSNLQVLLWTLAVFFALVFTWASTDTLLPLSTGVLGLLGIAAGGSALARGVERSGPVPAATKPPAQARWSELFNNPDNNGFDLLRFQMFVFTVFSLAYSLYSVVRSNGFPDLPDSLYWLMGVSNLGYVSGKVADVIGANRKAEAEAANPAAAPVQAADALPAEQVRRLQQRLAVPLTGVLDAATGAAVRQYKQDKGLYPVDGRVHQPLLKQLGIV